MYNDTVSRLLAVGVEEAVWVWARQTTHQSQSQIS